MEEKPRMMKEIEAARYLSLSRGKLRELIANYVIRGIEIGNRIFYDRNDLDAAVTWLHKNWHTKAVNDDKR